MLERHCETIAPLLFNHANCVDQFPDLRDGLALVLFHGVYGLGPGQSFLEREVLVNCSPRLRIARVGLHDRFQDFVLLKFVLFVGKAALHGGYLQVLVALLLNRNLLRVFPLHAVELNFRHCLFQEVQAVFHFGLR